MKTRIRELREAKNISQTKLALQIGITQSTLSKIENEQCIPDAEMIVHIAHHFRVSTDYILCQSDSRSPVNPLIEIQMTDHGNTAYSNALSGCYQLNHAQLNALHHFLVTFTGNGL